jgi:hypothetical protein
MTASALLWAQAAPGRMRRPRVCPAWRGWAPPRPPTPQIRSTLCTCGWRAAMRPSAGGQGWWPRHSCCVSAGVCGWLCTQVRVPGLPMQPASCKCAPGRLCCRPSLCSLQRVTMQPMPPAPAPAPAPAWQVCGRQGAAQGEWLGAQGCGADRAGPWGTQAPSASMFMGHQTGTLRVDVLPVDTVIVNTGNMPSVSCVWL